MGRTLISLYRERRAMKNIALLSLLTLASTGTSTISWNGNCVRDSPDRLLPTNAIPGDDLYIPSNTPARCMEACKDQGFLFAGVQYGHECWCGNDAPPEDKIVDMADCDYSCSGDSSQTCGGYWRMNVYRIVDCQLENTYLKGKPIENGESEIKNIPSWYDCQNLCDSNPQCESFTWNYWPSVCYLMSNVPGENYIGTFEGASSGIKSCWDPSNCKF